MVKRFLLFSTVLGLLGFSPAIKADDVTARDFDKSIERILSGTGLKAGVSMRKLETGETIAFKGNEAFPMASVYKFPIALAVFNEVDHGKLSLRQKIHVSKADFRPGGLSPLFKQYPDGNVDLTIEQLLKFMVSDSDNSACDLLLKAAGGPAEVTHILRAWGIQGISVNRYEKELAAVANAPGPDRLDTASPNAMTKLYALFYQGHLLKPESREKLLSYMLDSTTPAHIQSSLPPGVQVAHKSGWCSQDACLNDTAIVTLPAHEGHLAMAIFLAGKVDPKAISRKIGEIAKVGYDLFATK